ncbi:MAG: MBL fold metallo-hydrolase [Burkholderiales bacterium]|nr:MBL fold metallo-hydrolase [Burkholderiales bacterium]
MTSTLIGGVSLTRIVESEGPLLTPAEIFPDSTPEIIGGESHWLAPRYYDPAADKLVITIQSFLLRTPHHTILIDTCAGNHKPRRRLFFHQRKWPWLDALARTGTSPEAIDFVLCTHLHVDHVGWNTRLDRGRWVPTFPNARYLFARRELEYWESESRVNGIPRTGDYVADSVLPILDAGQALVVEEDYAIEDGIRIEPAPGHTPGHVVVNIANRNAKAVLSGDLFHHPLQCRFPDWSTNFCWDMAQARSTRRRFFEAHADSGTVVLPAHFPAPTAGYIERDRTGFRFRYDER